jgi:hypothetical protein
VASALAWSPAAWSATDAPVVSLDVAGECAGPRGASTLREEVRLRLPPGSTLGRKVEGAAWALEWGPGADGACGLRLSGRGELVVVPLEAMAEDARVREAAVRVAWWITTMEPEEPVAPEVEPVPAPEPAPEAAPEPVVEAEPVAPAADAGAVEEVAEPRSKEGGREATTGGKQDAVDVLNAELDAPSAAAPGEAEEMKVKDSVLQFTESLNGWKDESPELFAELGPAMTQPWALEVFGEQIPARLYFEASPRWSSMGGEAAGGLGVQVGAELAERFDLGLEYQNVEVELTEPGFSLDVDTQELALVAGFTLWDWGEWELGSQAKVGVAMASYRRIGAELMPVFGARTHVFYEPTTWLGFGFAVGYQAYGSLALLSGALEMEDMSSAYGQFLVRVTLF